MDSYLDIAQTVLREIRRPLTGREMLAQAYAMRLVPHQLHGKTQHKTLQARLSEDILTKRDNSLFFRTKPGRFFLREFIEDESIPGEFRVPIAARRRTRDLLTSPALAVRREFFDSVAGRDVISAHHFFSALDSRDYSYVDPKVSDSNFAMIWAVASVVRGSAILCYRVGRYRDDRDAFAQKRSVAFSSLVSEGDYSLFSSDRLGIEESALRAAVDDLDIPVRPTAHLGGTLQHEMTTLVPTVDGPDRRVLLAHVTVECPTWFEPMRRRLSLNDIQWIDISVQPNNLDDFDPWSRKLISMMVDRQRGAIDGASYSSS